MVEPSYTQLLSVRSVGQPTASPDERRVAVPTDGDVTVVDTATGERSHWETPRRNERWGISWDADGDHLVYPVGEEACDLHRVDATGESEPLVTDESLCVLQAVMSRVVLYSAPDDGVLSLYRYERSTGETHRVTTHEEPVVFARLSPDGRRVAYGVDDPADGGSSEVYLTDVDGTDRRQLSIGGVDAEVAPSDWHGQRLLVSDDSGGGARCGVYHLDEDTTEWYERRGTEETPLEFSPDGRRFLAIRTDGVTDQPVVYGTEDGTEYSLELPDGAVDVDWQNGIGRCHTAWLDTHRLVVRHTDPTTPPRAVAYDLRTNEYTSLVEPASDSVGPFASPDTVTVESDGVPEADARAVVHEPSTTYEIEGLLYDSTERPSSLVVYPHGGPRTLDQRRFSRSVQFLTAHGHSVLQVNYRGSSGYGREFVHALHGDWGGAEQGDIATVVEHVLDTFDWLDERRVAVFGTAFGGYAAYWQLLQYPALYAAGAGWLGLTDLQSLYDDVAPRFRSATLEPYLGDPTEQAARYEARSPVTHASNLDAPVAIIHSSDSFVPLTQAEALRDALADADVDQPVEYVQIDDGDRSRVFDRLASFLDRSLRDV